MKNKERDIPYYGVDTESIKNKRPNISDDRLRLFHQYITERYQIHLNRDVYHVDSYALVENPAFKKYKFCNVRREHDRTSQWYVQNIVKADMSFREKFYHAILFRIYNRIETVDLINLAGVRFFDQGFSFDNYIKKCEDLFKQAGEYRVFTNAYKTSGMTSSLTKQFPEVAKETTPVALIRKLIDEDLLSEVMSKMEIGEVFDTIKGIKGIGNFLAYQILIDLTYIDEFPWSENEYVVAGPGCFYGSELLLVERTQFGGLTPEEFVFWLRDNLIKEFNRIGIEFNPEEIFVDLPMEDRKLNVMMLENCLCEFQKFVRANSPEMSNPRNKYHKFKYEDPLAKK